MTNEAMRFLALNGLLHGHSVLKGFDDSIEKMADALSIEVSEAEDLVKKLDALPVVPTSDDPLVNTFLNFYRTQAYAFMAMEGTIIPLEKFVATDLDGQVADDVRYMFLTHLIMDVSQRPEYVNPIIKDGILYCTAQDFQHVEPAMLEAYQLYMTGPAGTQRGFYMALRKFTSLEHYSRLTPSTMVKVLRYIVKAKKNPIIYQQTMLNTPDLLTTYKHTGCIIAYRDLSHTSVNWLLDVEGALDSTMSMVVDVSTLRHYLVKDVRDLAGIKVARGLGEGGKILFPGVV